MGRSERTARARRGNRRRRGQASRGKIEAGITMSRTAQDVLEFDKLRELLRLRTTCAPGRRAVDALEFNENRVALEAAFALIREAREWLRGGAELGFGALADPEEWLVKLEGPGAVLEAKEFLDA